MSTQYIQNLNQWWFERKDLIGRICDLTGVVFHDQKITGSAWEGLSFLYEEMNLLNKDIYNIKIEQNFFMNMVYFLQKEELENLAMSLEQMRNSGGTQLPAVDKGVEMKIILVCSAMLYLEASETYTLNQLADDLEDGKDIHWPSAMRFLGQAFFGNDAETRDWAIDFLRSTPKFDRSLRDSPVEFLFMIILIHIAFRDFYYLNPETKFALLQKYLWNALCLGLDVEEKIKEYLIDEPFLDYYLQASGLFAEAIVKNTETVFYNDKPEVTIEHLIQQYLSGSGEKGPGGYDLMSFVESRIMANSWPRELSEKLIKILYLYIHLRDCDLIDYRGFLSEAGLVEVPVDLKRVLGGDIKEQDREKIKEYFKIYNRPFSTRVEIIVHLKTIPWQEEPFLSRALILSNIYEEVFGPVWGALLYFSEETGQWKLNEIGPPDNA